MNWLLELIAIVSEGLGRFTPRNLGLTLAAALGFALLCGWICLHYVQLWNKRFQLTTTHKIFTALACTFTFFFVLAFAGLAFMREITQAQIIIWQGNLKEDQDWSQRTFEKTYHKVKESGKEDISTFPPIERNIIPVTHNDSQLLAAQIYSNEACTNFDEMHPFLSKIVWATPSLPTEVIHSDVTSFFKSNPGKTYPTINAIDLAAKHIKDELLVQAPRVVTISRIGLVLAFILVQLVPFGIIGVAAYKDIKSSL
ncbi:hypothetical protein [Telluribacter sp. SYSU D00476]|uniref:hypothetical protein n=1 Tax=Telluribacter sp. SYSU D00476 TaxID=2811430 RepID=UPI001FF5D3FD|nr:hypothetical protein [Telluribacter sp. SYSU D00476]